MFHPKDDVERSVAIRARDGQSARAVILSRRLQRPPSDVWHALTTSERIPRWFLPISGNLNQGGRFQLEGNAGGEILACEPPRHLAVTWEFAGQVSWVTVDLAPDGAGTHFQLEHVAVVDDEFWPRFGPGAVGVGWDMALLGLGLHLETGETLDPSAAMAWFGTDEGRAWMRTSSDAWGRASAAAGTPTAEALAAAERTWAAYTGAPEPTSD